MKKELLKIIKLYLQSNESIITHTYKIDNFNDYPPLYQYTTTYAMQKTQPDSLLSNGISTNRNEAKVKAVMETIERWHLHAPLSKENSIIFQIDRESHISKKILLKPPELYNHNSTGAAAATTKEYALYRGICEVIERDAFAIFYYNKLSPNIIKGPHSKKIFKLLNILKEYHFKVTLLNLTLDITIPICLCILEDTTGIKPNFTLGLKCSLSWDSAIEGAILEAIQSLTAFRSIAQYDHKKSQIFSSTLKRLQFSFDQKPKDFLPFFFTGKTTSIKQSRYNKNKFDSVVSLLTLSVNTPLYWRLIYEYKNIYVIKVYIPGLVKLSLKSGIVDVVPDRLLKLPVMLGLLDKQRTISELNQQAHPFP